MKIGLAKARLCPSPETDFDAAQKPLSALLDNLDKHLSEFHPLPIPAHNNLLRY
jgi:hypothetical protein